MVSQRSSPNGARIAIVGIGSELRGDDAAGILIARALVDNARIKSANKRAGDSLPVLILEGGAAPENLTGSLRRFQPSMVLLIDAAVMGERPGTTRWLDPHNTFGFSPSTHMLPLHLLAHYLESELCCPVSLLGIQPANLEFESRPSPAVAKAIRATAQALGQMLGPQVSI